MSIKHNYLTIADTKPTAAETSQHEIVVNEADGSLWSKNSSDVVFQVGGMDNGTPSPTEGQLANNERYEVICSVGAEIPVVWDGVPLGELDSPTLREQSYQVELKTPTGSSVGMAVSYLLNGSGDIWEVFAVSEVVVDAWTPLLTVNGSNYPIITLQQDHNVLVNITALHLDATVEATALPVAGSEKEITITGTLIVETPVAVNLGGAIYDTIRVDVMDDSGETNFGQAFAIEDGRNQTMHCFSKTGAEYSRVQVMWYAGVITVELQTHEIVTGLKVRLTGINHSVFVDGAPVDTLNDQIVGGQKTFTGNGSAETMIVEDPISAVNPYTRVSFRGAGAGLGWVGFDGSELMRISSDNTNGVRISVPSTIQPDPHDFTFTSSGILSLVEPPAGPEHAANKGYVDLVILENAIAFRDDLIANGLTTTNIDAKIALLQSL